MRLILPYFLLLAFALQLGSRIYVLVSFQINKEYIKENLCEKKDEPESCCEGSCCLAKELNKIEEKEQQGPAAPESKKEKTEEFPGMLVSEYKPNLEINLIINTYRSFNERQVLSGYHSKVFHPPA